MTLNLIQKKVLCAMNAYPEYNDRELASVLKSKRSTVTAARHFLTKNNYFKTSLFPSYENLKIPLLAFKYGDYGKFNPIGYKKRMELMPENIKIDECVFSISSEFKGFSMFFVSEFHKVKDKIDAWNSLFESVDPSVSIRDIYFPREMVKSYKFMDLQCCLSSVLGVDHHLPKKKIPRKKPLSQKEKEVIHAWFNNPVATNEELSSRINVSRAVIGSIKKRLLDMGVIRIIHLPQWSKLGINLGVLTYLRENLKEREILQQLEELPEVIFIAGSHYEVIFISIFRDYKDYQKKLLPLIAELKRKKQITKEPEELLFNLDETIFSIDANQLIKELFRHSH